MASFRPDKPFRVFQADPHHTGDLERELVTWDAAWGPLYAANPEHPVYWWRNRWDSPFIFSFSSIKEAASVLRSVQRNWAGVQHSHYGRARLIQEALPPLSGKRRPLDFTAPSAPMGAWSLIDERTILASAECASPFPGGIIEFDEDKTGPPSRAYLKLAEVFARTGLRPSANERCLDAGASPGGWTWYLARYSTDGAPSVLAVDRAPLDPRVAALPAVTFLRHDVFTLKPAELGPVDWLFCDAACYPARLYGWIENWLEAGTCRRFVCTLKMQGTEGMDEARRFARLPGSRLVHLYHNKHELTWLKGL